MVVAVALWSLELQPGTPQTIVVENDLRITNVALGADIAEENGRTSVKLTYKGVQFGESDDEEDDDEEDEEEEKEKGYEEVTRTTILCSLTPGKIEQALVNLILEEEQEVTFEVVGKNTVYLTGNYVDQTPPGHDHDHEHDEDDSDFDEEDPYGLEGGSSDFEMDELEVDAEEDDSHRFEVIEDETEAANAKNEASTSASKKRSRESDAADTDEPKLSKAEKKKLNKKLKAENGEAVPTGSSEKEVAKPKEEKKDKKEKKGKKEKEQAKKDEGEKSAQKVEIKELAGGLKIKDTKTGSGPQAKKGDLVMMRYVGKLQNGTQFDANTKGKPFKFRLGKGEVIKGWDLGIAGMQAGGERTLTIPSDLAYGKKGSGPIPANATLTFDVKLVGIN